VRSLTAPPLFYFQVYKIYSPYYRKNTPFKYRRYKTMLGIIDMVLGVALIMVLVAFPIYVLTWEKRWREN